jgi:hypothetical protein
MTHHVLNYNEVEFIGACVSVAARHWQASAEANRGNALAKQFIIQEKRACTLALLLREAETITVKVDIETADMPWCDYCTCYHHSTADHITKPEEQ